MGTKNKVQERFKEITIDIGTGICTMSSEKKTINIGLNGVEVAPFGHKLCQHVTPRLRIIFQALLGLKDKLNKSTTPKNVEHPSLSPFKVVKSI